VASISGKEVDMLKPDTKTLEVTRQQAELILDSFKVTNPVTREIALKAAGLVLEWEAEDAVKTANTIMGEMKQWGG
jgi:hypothetical protein